MLGMHVVVRQTVNKEQFAVEPVCHFREVSLIVAALIDLRATHETLGIAAIVEAPIRHRRNSYRTLEAVSRLAERTNRLITTVTPPDNRNPLGVYERQ